MVRRAPTPATTPAPLQLGGSSLPALELPGASLGMGMNGLRDFWCFGTGVPRAAVASQQHPNFPGSEGSRRQAVAAGGTVGTVQLCQTPTGNPALETLHWKTKPALENTSLENSTPTRSFTAHPPHLCPLLSPLPGAARAGCTFPTLSHRIYPSAEPPGHAGDMGCRSRSALPRATANTMKYI